MSFVTATSVRHLFVSMKTISVRHVFYDSNISQASLHINQTHINQASLHVTQSHNVNQLSNSQAISKKCHTNKSEQNPTVKVSNYDYQQTPGLYMAWCCLPNSSSVCLVFFPLSLCLARWFRPDLMNKTWPYHCSLHLFTMVKKSLCGPIARWILAWTSSLITNKEVASYVLSNKPMNSTCSMYHRSEMPTKLHAASDGKDTILV